MANSGSNEIEIKITAENKDVIEKFRQVVEAARSVSGETSAAGEKAGQGFDNSAREIQSDSNAVVGILNKISSTLSALASKFGVMKAEGTSAMEETSSAANSTASSVAAANEKISQSNNETAESRKKLNQEMNKKSSGKSDEGSSISFFSAITSGEGFLAILGKIGLAAEGLKATFGTLITVIKEAFTPGIEFDRQLETTQLGIAGIIMSMETTNGQAIQFNDSMAIAGKTMEALQTDAAKIGLPLRDMTTAFQSIIGPALQAKMTMDQAEKFTVTGTKAVKTMLGPQANDIQITQELRSMVSGNIDQDSQVARAMGITNQQVNQAKQSAGGLFDYLMDRLSGFQAVAEHYPDTFNGTIERFETMFQQAEGGAIKPFMESFRKGLNDIISLLFEVNSATGKIEFNSNIVSVIDSIKSALTDLQPAFDSIKTLAINLYSSLSPIFAEIGKLILALIPYFSQLISVLSNIIEAIIPALKSAVETVSSAIQYLIENLSSLIRIIEKVAIGFATAKGALMAYDAAVLIVSKRMVFAEMATKAYEAAKAIMSMKKATDLLGLAMSKLNKRNIIFSLLAAGGVIFSDKIMEWAEKLGNWLGMNTGGDSSENNSWGNRGDRDYSPLDNKHGNPDIPLENKYNDPSQLDIQNSQAALDSTIDSITANYNSIKTSIDSELGQLEVLKSTGQLTDVNEYINRKNELNESQYAAAVSAAQQKYDAAASALYSTDADRTKKLASLNEEITTTTNTLQTFQDAINDSRNLMDSLRYGLGSIGNYANSDIVNESGQWKDLIMKYAEKFGVSPVLISSIMKAESSFNPNAGSSAGAQGLMQLMPDTASGLGVSDPWDPEQNIMGGVKYLRQLLDQFGGDVVKTIAGYNAGPQAVKDYQGVPPYAETQDYVQKVTGFMGSDQEGYLNQSHSASTLSDQLRDKLAKFTSQAGRQVYEAMLEIVKQLDSAIGELQSLKGNDTLHQKAELVSKYRDILINFQTNFSGKVLQDALDTVAKIKAIQSNRIDIAQTKKDIENAFTDFSTVQQQFVEQNQAGIMDAGQIYKKFVSRYSDTMAPYLKQLNDQLWLALPEQQDDKESVRNIRAQYASIQKVFGGFVDKAVTAIKTQVDQETTAINLNPELTDSMKSFQLDKAKKNGQQQISAVYSQLYVDLLDPNSAESKIAVHAQLNPATLAQQADYAAKIADQEGRIVSLMEQVNKAGRQGLENGLVNFFEQGYQSCHKLIDAIRDLSIAVLTEMNKVFSQDLARRVMQSIGWKTADSSGGGEQDFNLSYSPFSSGGKGLGFASGGSMANGQVKGPGTGTSDSILAWVGNLRKFVRLSDGEYVMKSAAVKKYGTDVMDRINQGLIPSGFGEIKAKYATGGSLSGRQIVGADRVANSLALNPNVTVPVSIFNYQDHSEFLKAMAGKQGESIFINHMNRNMPLVNRILTTKR